MCVLPSLPRALIAVVLALSIGLHWTVLQTVAWAGMVVTYSKDASLTVALVKTFDGQHPCNLCTEIQKAKKAEKKQDAKPELKKFTLLNDKEDRWIVSSPTEFYLLNWAEASALITHLQPPVPPPRSGTSMCA
jgi:hypothetical protein